jgi:hypothetical protein
MEKKSFSVNNEDNIREITTFVKHVTSSGNIRYAADIGHDDTVMTLVNASSVFEKYEYREIVEDYATEIVPSYKLSEWNTFLKNVDFVQGADYSSIINVNKMRKYFVDMKKFQYIIKKLT